MIAMKNTFEDFRLLVVMGLAIYKLVQTWIINIPTHYALMK